MDVGSAPYSEVLSDHSLQTQPRGGRGKRGGGSAPSQRHTRTARLIAARHAEARLQIPSGWIWEPEAGEEERTSTAWWCGAPPREYGSSHVLSDSVVDRRRSIDRCPRSYHLHRPHRPLWAGVATRCGFVAIVDARSRPLPHGMPRLFSAKRTAMVAPGSGRFSRQGSTAVMPISAFI